MRRGSEAVVEQLPRFGSWVVVSGAREVEVADVDEFINSARYLLRAEHQLLSADLVVSPKHLVSAAYHALTAFELGENITKTLSMEIMLYASARRQISEALSVLGVKPGRPNVAMVAVCRSLSEAKQCVEDLSEFFGASKLSTEVLEVTPQKVAAIEETFWISREEVLALTSMGISYEDALVELVLERVALLAARK